MAPFTSNVSDVCSGKIPFKASLKGYPPGNDHISHQTGKGAKSSIQKCQLGGGYVSSHEDIRVMRSHRGIPIE